MTRRRAVVVSRRRHAVCIRSSVSARCSHCRAVQAASWPQPSRLTAAYHRSRTRDVTEQLGRQGRCRRDQRVHRRVTLGDEAPNETAVRSAAHADCARSPPRNAAARPSMRLRSVPRLTGRRRGRRPWWLVALRAAGTGCAVVAHRAEVLRGARYGDRHRSGHRRELHTVAVSSDSGSVDDRPEGRGWRARPQPHRHGSLRQCTGGQDRALVGQHQHGCNVARAR